MVTRLSHPSRSVVREMTGFTDFDVALQQAIGDAKQGDPFAPVHVVVPSGRAAQSISRRLGRQGGCVNVQFMTIERLAATIVESAAVPFVRLTSRLRRELVRRVAVSALPPLEGHGSSVLVESLSRSFDDLRRRSEAEVRHIAEEGGALAREVVRLYRSFRQTSEQFVDNRDLIELAAQYVDESITPVIAVFAEPLSSHEIELFAAIAKFASEGRFHAFAVLSGDASADGLLRTSLWGLSAKEVAIGPGSNVQAVAILPDAEAETRHAIAKLLSAAGQGTRFAKMALLHGNSSPYAMIAHDQLAAAGIPISGHQNVNLSQSVAGRFLLGLLRIHADDFDRASVSAWLSCAPIVDPVTGELIDAATWCRVAKAARVRRSRAQWVERLERYASSDEARRRDQSNVAKALSRFVEEAAIDTAHPPTCWAQWALWLQQKLERHLGVASQRISWPLVEQEAAIHVERSLLELAELDEILGSDGDQGEVSLDVFSSALRDELSRPHRRSVNRQGVFVGSLDKAVMCDFDVVVICGVAEGVLPGVPNDDVLTAALRVPGEETSIEREHRRWGLVLQGAGQVLITAPAVDQRAQRERRPSPWMIEEATRLAGALVQATDLLTGALVAPWLEVVPSFSAQVGAGSPSVSRQHARLVGLSAGCDLDKTIDARLAASMHVVCQRDSSSWTRFDGVIGNVRLLETSKIPISPTALEHWAECPFRFFLRTGLSVAENEEDDEPTATMARDRGVLIHRTLERFFRETEPRVSSEQPWSESERNHLHRIAEQLYEDSRADGRSPDGLLLELERSTLHRHLDAVLDDDAAFRSREGFVPDPAGLEMRLSVTSDGPVPVRFQGRVDRVDRAPDKARLLAIDYKTGRADKFGDLTADPVDGGRKLQLALYARALADRYPDTEVEAQYWFVADEKSGYARRGVRFDDATRERLGEIVDVVVGGIESGVFPPIPGKELNGSYDNCRYCPYDSVCPSDRGELWDRKADERVDLAMRQLEGAS